MVGSAAALLVEVVDTLNQSLADALDALELVTDDILQLVDVADEGSLLDVQSLVRTEGGANLGVDGGISSDLCMELQGVDGIVGGADHVDVGLLDQATSGHGGVVLQLVVGQIPDFLSGLAVQDAVVAEVALQLQVAPVVHGVANALGQSFCELLELLAVGSVTGDVLFLNTVAAHNSPLVVVAAQPNLSDVLKLAVLPDFLGVDVAVVVQNGHLGSVIVIQGLRGLVGQQEVLVHKLLHWKNPLSFY